MTLEKIAKQSEFEVLYLGEDRAVTGVYCCDLLSIAMTKVPAGAVWVTVMSNLNTLAVASLTEAGCVILAEGVAVEEKLIERAKQQGITLFRTELPIFETAWNVHNLLQIECVR